VLLHTEVTFKKLIKTQKAMFFKYICFIDGIIKSGLQIFGVNDLDNQDLTGF